MTAADISASFKKQPVGFVCGLLSVILAGLLYFQTSKIDDSQAEYEAKSAEASKIVANVAASKNLAEQVQEIQSQAKDLEGRLVHAGQLAVNLQYFYKLEAENEVKLLDVRQNNLPKSNGAMTYIAVPFSVTVQGPFKQVMLFLNRLENGRHFCHFSSASFSKLGGGDSSSQNTVTLTLSLELLGQP